MRTSGAGIEAGAYEPAGSFDLKRAVCALGVSRDGAGATAVASIAFVRSDIVDIDLEAGTTKSVSAGPGVFEAEMTPDLGHLAVMGSGNKGRIDLYGPDRQRLWRKKTGAGTAAVALASDGKTVAYGEFGATKVDLKAVNGEGEPLFSVKAPAFPVGCRVFRGGSEIVLACARVNLGLQAAREQRPGLYAYGRGGLLAWEQSFEADEYRFDADAAGNLFVMGMEDGTVLAVGRGGKPIWSRDVGATVGWVSVSPDGERVAVMRGSLEDQSGDLRLFDARGATMEVDALPSAVTFMGWAGTSGLLMVFTYSGDLWVIDPTGGPAWRKKVGGHWGWMDASDDGEFVLVASGRSVKAFRRA